MQSSCAVGDLAYHLWYAIFIFFCQPSPRLPNAEEFYPKAAQVCREAGRTQLLSDLEARVGKLADLEARLDKSNKQEARLDKSTRGNKRKKQHKDKDKRNSKIVGLCGAGQWEEALQLFSEMSLAKATPRQKTYSCLVYALQQSQQWQLVLHLLGDMPAGMTTDKMVDAIFFDRTIGLEGLTSLLCEMRVRKVTPNAALLTECIVACGVAQEWQRALDVLGDRRTTSTYSAAISACDRGNEPLQALALLQEMHQKEIAPNSYTYTGALAACRRGGYWQFALQLLQQMKKAQLAPAIENYGAALSACSAPRSHSVGLCSHSLNIFAQTFHCMWLSWRSATIVSFIMFRT